MLDVWTRGGAFSFVFRLVTQRTVRFSGFKV